MPKTQQANTRNRSRSHVVAGHMRVQLIPAKSGAFRVHHPMVALSFRMENGDEVNIYVSEDEHSAKVYDHLKTTFSTPPCSELEQQAGVRFIKSLYIPNFSSSEEV